MRNIKNNKSELHSAKRSSLQIALCLFLFAYCTSTYAQSNLKPFIKTGGSLTVYSRIFTDDLSLAAGAHFNDHLSLQMGVNFINYMYEDLDVLILSISPFYRIFKSKHPVSPVIGIDLGTQIWSNGNGRLTYRGYNFTSYDPNSSNIRYKRGQFFGKVKLLADFKIKSFNLMVGPTFNLMFLENEKVKKNNLDEYTVIGGFIDDNYGYGAELSLMYTFPMKKQQSKKAGVGD